MDNELDKHPYSYDGNNELDKRPYIMDLLLAVGHDMAAITHIQEKIQYLNSDLEGTDDEDKIKTIVDEIANLLSIKKIIYDGYDTKMSFIFSHENTKKEYRCLIKHTSTMLVLAMELDDALNNEMSGDNLKTAFSAFAGAVSLGLGIEFKDCLRCIYDGLRSFK